MEKKELGKLALSKKIRKKIEQDLSKADDKKTLFVGLRTFAPKVSHVQIFFKTWAAGRK